MATGLRVTEVLLDWKIKDGSIQKVAQGTDTIIAALERVEHRALTVEDAAQAMNDEFAKMARAKAVDMIADNALAAARNTDEWSDSLRYVAEQLSAIGATDSEIQQVAHAIANAEEEVQRYEVALTAAQQRQRALLLKGTSGIGRGGSFETLDRIGSLGSQVAGGLGGSAGVGNAAGLIGDIAGGLSAFGAAGGVVAVALGAATVATKAYTDALTANSERANSFADALTQAFETGTQAQINALIRQQEVHIAALTATSQVLEERAEAARSQLAISFDNASADLANFLNQLAGGAPLALRDASISAESYEDALNKNNVEIVLAQAALDAYRVVLEQGTTATAAAADAERDLANARNPLKEIADDYTRRAVDLAQYTLQVDNMTAEQRQVEAANIQRQLQILEQLRVAYEKQGNHAAAAELTQQMTRLKDQLEIVTNTTNTLADQNAALAAIQAALKQQTDNYFAALEAEVKAQEALFAAREKEREERDKYIEDGRKLAQEAQDDLNEIIADGEEKRAEIAEKTQKAIAKIERDYARDRMTAIAERDALAAHQAAIQRQDDIDDTKEDEDERLQEQEKAQQKQIDSLKESITKQAAALDAGYRRQQEITTAAINRAQVDLINAKNQEAMIAMYGAGTLRTIQTNFLGDLTMLYTNYTQGIVNTVGFMLNYANSAYTQYPFSVGNQQPTNYGTQGAFIPASNMAANGVTINISGATSPSQVRREVDLRLSDYFRRAGYTED